MSENNNFNEVVMKDEPVDFYDFTIPKKFDEILNESDDDLTDNEGSGAELEITCVDEEQEEQDWNVDETDISNQPLTSSSSTPALSSQTTAASESIPQNACEEDVASIIEDNEKSANVDDVSVFPDQQELYTEEVRPSCPKRGRSVMAGRPRFGRGCRRPRCDNRTPWKRGDRLVEVYLTDDGMSEDLRDRIMKLVTDREARAKKNERKRTIVDDDEIEDDGNAALFDGDKDCLNFNWSPMDTFRGEREVFLPKKTGPMKPSKSPYEAFRQYWDDDIISYIATETNRYAAELSRTSVPFAREWYDTNFHEIFILFSFWIMLGIIHMPSTKSCFTDNPILKTHIFRRLFSRQRYLNLCRALNFVNNETRTLNSGNLFPIEPIIAYLNSRFKSAYIPTQEICINESLTLRSKAVRFGMKTLELCESTTGYMWSFFVYTWKDKNLDHRSPSSLLVSTKTVLKLIRPLLDKGYTVFMDSSLNSPLLARYLKKRKTDCVGTLRVNRKSVSPLIALCRPRDGELFARHSGDVVTMIYQDSKLVALISTYHDTEQVIVKSKTNSCQWKPKLFTDYNKYMCGTDRKDRMLPYLLEGKRCLKWYLKLFKQLLNVSIMNARIHREKSSNESKDDLVFRLELVTEIMEKHISQVPRLRREVNPNPRRVDLSARRLTDNVHWPKAFSARNGRTSRRRCIWCQKRKVLKLTTFHCEYCYVALCIEPCFKLYHTVD